MSDFDQLPCFSEAELMEAAYGHCFSLCDSTGYDGVEFTVDLEILQCQLKISLPTKYPDEPLEFKLTGDITHAEGTGLRLDLNQFVCETPQIGSFDLCQRTTELLRSLKDAKTAAMSCPSKPVFLRQSVTIARFLIYFHHIMSGAKRAFIQDCARCLSLGGFSKPGYPGIVMVEGDKLAVLEWVQRVQRLRWKHMVVRGEQIETLFPFGGEEAGSTALSEADAALLIDRNRKLPSNFLGEVADTSTAGSICENYSIHDLFLTAMKIYTVNSGDIES